MFYLKSECDIINKRKEEGVGEKEKREELRGNHESSLKSVAIVPPRHYLSDITSSFKCLTLQPTNI